MARTEDELGGREPERLVDPRPGAGPAAADGGPADGGPATAGGPANGGPAANADADGPATDGGPAANADADSPADGGPAAAGGPADGGPAREVLDGGGRDDAPGDGRPASPVRPAGERPRDAATDRDQVDFTAAATWLRRRGLLSPARPPRPPVLIPARERAAAGRPASGIGGGGLGDDPIGVEDIGEGGGGAAPPRSATVVERFLGTRGTDPGVAAMPWQQWDWTPDAATRPVTKDRLGRGILVVATVAYVWLFSYWTMRHHDGYGTQAFDFGIYDQGLWLMSRFKRPFVTVMGRHLFGDHTSFIMLPLVPVYWILPSAKVLLFAQAAALGGAAVPVFLLAREKLNSERLAAILAVVYLLHPAVAFTNLEQFHPDAFEPVIVLFALWFMVRRRWLGFLICVGLVLLVKEDVALLTLPLGIYVAIRHDRRVGVIASLMSLVMISAALWWILPMYNGVGSLNSWRVPFGGLGGLVKTVLFHPGDFISYATEKPRTWYVWQMFTPVAFMPLLDPKLLAVAVPVLAANVLSTFYYQYDFHYHYGTLLLPMLLGATIFAISRARSMAGRQVMVGIVAASTLVTAYLWGPTPLGRNEAAIASPDGNSIPFLERANDIIPRDAVLSAFYGYVPHFDHREEIYMFPNPFAASYWGTFKTEGQRLPQADRVEYILLPTALDPQPKGVLDQIRGDYETIMEEGNVTLLRKKGLSP